VTSAICSSWEKLRQGDSTGSHWQYNPQVFCVTDNGDRYKLNCSFKLIMEQRPWTSICLHSAGGVPNVFCLKYKNWLTSRICLNKILAPLKLITDLHHMMISSTLLEVHEARLVSKVLVLLFCVMYHPTIKAVYSALD